MEVQGRSSCDEPYRRQRDFPILLGRQASLLPSDAGLSFRALDKIVRQDGLFTSTSLKCEMAESAAWAAAPPFNISF